MVCPNCGKEVAEGNKFCTNCGTPVVAPQEPVVEEVVPTTPLVDEPIVESTVEPTTPVVDEPVVTPVQEPVVAPVQEQPVAAPVQEPVAQTTTTTTTNTVAPKAQKANGKGRLSVITIVLVAMVALVVALIVTVFCLLAKTPKKVYKGAIEEAINGIFNNKSADATSAKATAGIELNTDIEGLDMLDNLKAQGDVQVDLDKLQVYFGTDASLDGEDYLNLKMFVDLMDKKAYLNEKNIYKKTVSVDLPEDEVDELIETIKSQTEEGSTKSARKKEAKYIAQAITNNIPDTVFTTEKDVVIEVNGKEKKVKNFVMTLNGEDLEAIITNATVELYQNKDFMGLFKDPSQVEMLLDNLNTSAEDIDEDVCIEVDYFVSGMFNTFEGFAIVAKDSYYDEGGAVQVIKQAKNEYQASVISIDGEDAEELLVADITVNEMNDNTMDVTVSTNIEDAGNIKVRAYVTVETNKGIDAFNTAGAVALEDIDSDDQEEIMENIEESPIYTLLSYAGLNTDIDDDYDYDDEDELPSGIVLKADQSYVKTYDDDVVLYTLPASLDESYKGSTYKTYSKRDADYNYAHVTVSTRYDTMDEYTDSVKGSLDYFKDLDNYTDIKVSNPEKVKVGDREYYKMTSHYKYVGTSGYEYEEDTVYYFTEISKDYVYVVEIEDAHKVLNDSEINKLLTIEIKK